MTGWEAPEDVAPHDQLVVVLGGRAWLRDAGYVPRQSPAEAAVASRRGAPVELAGVPVDLTAIVRGLASSERGRAALRRRGIKP